MTPLRVSSFAPAGRSGLLDAWRAVACLAVVLFHGSEAVKGSITLPLLAKISLAGHYGWLGVSVFFVISGYCLAQTIEHRAMRHVGPRSFWRDRLFRIYPVYWIALLLAILLGFAASFFNHQAGAGLLASPIAWFANFGLITSWLGLPPRLTVSWSLNYEIGFYALIGFALFKPFDTPARRLLLYATVTLFAHLPGGAQWFPLLGLWPQFACGIAIHAARSTRLPNVARLLAGCYPFGLALALLLLPGDHLATLTAAGAALLLFLTLIVETHLPSPPAWLTALGVASYSIYLVHLSFMSPAINLVRRFLPTDGPAFAAAWLIALGFGVAAGVVFHRLVERRCERLRARLGAADFRSSAPASLLGRLRQTRAYARLRDWRYLWENRARRRFYAGFVARRSLVFDVGANVGHYTLLCRSLGARVLAIEPQAVLVAGLRKRFGGDHWPVRIERCAVGAAAGEALLRKTASLTEVASLRDDIAQTSRFAAEHAFDRSETVPVTTLETLIARHGVPDFCKIDVEGFEREVLTGLRTPLLVVSFEFNREYLTVAEDCLAVLGALGPYRFNYALGEECGFASSQWLDAGELLATLRGLADPLLWGDIYAHLSAPEP